MVHELSVLAKNVSLLRQLLKQQDHHLDQHHLQDHLDGRDGRLFESMAGGGLNTINNEPLRVMAVVGKAHIPGILALWENSGIEREDWKPPVNGVSAESIMANLMND